MTPNGAAWRYEYNIKDHLGNTRLSFAELGANGIIDVTNSATTTEILNENHYYPFGMNMNYDWINNTATGMSIDNKQQYNGKEMKDDWGWGWSDYGARWYDAAVPHWWVVDPMAENFVSWSPYNYVKNTPVKATDPDGMACQGCGPNGEDYFAPGNAIGANTAPESGKDWYLPKGGKDLVYDPSVHSQQDLDDRGVEGTYQGETTNKTNGEDGHTEYLADGTKIFRGFDGSVKHSSPYGRGDGANIIHYTALMGPAEKKGEYFTLPQEKPLVTFDLFDDPFFQILTMGGTKGLGLFAKETEAAEDGTRAMGFLGKGNTFRGGSKALRDNWYGLEKRKDFKQFKQWWHREGKEGRDIDNMGEALDALQEWIDLGKPTPK